MKTMTFCSMIILGTLPLTTLAEEASSTFSWGSVTFQPRVYTGYADYSLKSDNFDMTIGEGKYKPLDLDLFAHHKLQLSGPLGGVGGTIATGKFFSDIYYQSTFNETAYSGSLVKNENILRDYSDVNGQHYDWALSIGYMITDQWSVFGGYKSGNTNWDQNFNEYDISLSKPVRNLKVDFEFDQKGPFIGTSYFFPIGPGLITIKGAYAYLDGNYTYDLNKLTENSPSSVQLNLDGNSNAYSFGISWVQPITDNFGYSLGVNYHNYKFDMSGTIDDPGIIGGKIRGGSLTEQLVTLTASLLYTF